MTSFDFSKTLSRGSSYNNKPKLWLLRSKNKAFARYKQWKLVSKAQFCAKKTPRDSEIITFAVFIWTFHVS